MEQSKVTQVIGPALGAAAVVVLVGVLVSMSEFGGPATNPSAGNVGPARPAAPGDLPMEFKLDGPEWKDIGNGMKQWDVSEGGGDVCPPGAGVKIHYTGWTTDGAMFDSSKTRGEPAEFPLGNLIQGWQKGIPGMKVGGVRRLLIPPELGYGSRAQAKIPANSTLVFEVELLGFK